MSDSDDVIERKVLLPVKFVEYCEERAIREKSSFDKVLLIVISAGLNAISVEESQGTRALIAKMCELMKTVDESSAEEVKRVLKDALQRARPEERAAYLKMIRDQGIEL